MDEPLQACPFCGSRDLEVQPDGRVHCRACDAWGPAAKSPEGPTWSRRADAWADEDTLTYEVPTAGTYQGFALFLLGFALAALALVFTQIGELTRWRYLGAARGVAVLLLLSILCGAAQLVLAHLDLQPLRRWRGLLFLAQVLLAAAAALPMATAFLFD